MRSIKGKKAAQRRSLLADAPVNYNRFAVVSSVRGDLFH